MHRALHPAGRLLLFVCAFVAGLSQGSGYSSQLNPAACMWSDPALQGHERQIAQAIWKANVSRSTLVVHPSRAYSGVWLRDSFWTITAIGDVRLSAGVLRHFTRHQNRLGQLPTQFTTFLDDPVYAPDESTLLYLIWAAWQVQHGGPRPPTSALRKALAYVLSQARGGAYQSPKGGYVSWLDSFRLPHADTLAFNQGLYAVALESAVALHLPVSASTVKAAGAGYRALVDRRGGYLQLSRRLNYHDISGLTGEFLSLWLFKRPLLSDEVVRRTIETQPQFRGGFQVVVLGNGTYLSPQAFTVEIPPGDYQNGGSWLLYDYLSLAVGQLHHVPGMVERMRERLVAEFAGGLTFHEYLNTNPISPIFGRDAAIRDGFSWSTFVLRVDALLRQRCSGG
ncbi:MAG TPA: hypothetical protein VHB98_05775 [Chloroflexota bacterium]|nr:hypothetical protein [Chloroflexota bacterium]